MAKGPFFFAISAMESSKGEESGEIYSPNKQGKYTPEAAMPEGVPCFSVQGLIDALTTEILDVQLLPSVEFTLQLEVMMADCLGHPHPSVQVECGQGHAHTQKPSHTQRS